MHSDMKIGGSSEARNFKKPLILFFKRIDVNSILKTSTASWAGVCPFRIQLELGNIPLMKGVVIDPKNDYEKDPVSGWGEILSTVIFSHLRQNSARASAKDFIIRTSLQNKKLIIDVCDNGSGIPRTIEKKLFGKGATFASQHYMGGEGLGLYHSRKALEMLGGTIDLCRNVPLNEATALNPSGATFRITLPTSPKKPF